MATTGPINCVSRRFFVENGKLKKSKGLTVKHIIIHYAKKRIIKTFFEGSNVTGSGPEETDFSKAWGVEMAVEEWLDV